MLSIHIASETPVLESGDLQDFVSRFEAGVVEDDDLSVALAPEERDTLASLMVRYGEVLAEIDLLNIRLEEMLLLESPSAARS